MSGDDTGATETDTDTDTSSPGIYVAWTVSDMPFATWQLEAVTATFSETGMPVEVETVFDSEGEEFATDFAVAQVVFAEGAEPCQGLAGRIRRGPCL